MYSRSFIMRVNMLEVRRFLSLSASHCNSEPHGNFRVLDLKKKKTNLDRRRTIRKPPVLPPRSESMAIDQDWVSMWTGPRSFHPAAVPLPIRQGYPVREDAPSPGKYGNAELMKIPNFLHLTPPAIQRHCEALKQFCTPWPKVLETDEDCDKYFPISIVSNDYCHSSPSIRNPLSRITVLKVKLSSLTLDSHAKDKLLRLVAERYDPKTDTIMILTDRCPTKKQNKDYAFFILAALYHESWKTEAWEKEKQIEDMEVFNWNTSASKAAIDQLTDMCPNFDQDAVISYANVLHNLIDGGESLSAIEKYKEGTKKLLAVQGF